MVACLDAGGVIGRRGDGKGHLHLATVAGSGDLEPDTFEDADHRRVVGHHLPDETLDPTSCGERGQLLEQARRDAPALIGVGHGEGDLGARRIAKPNVVGESDDSVSARLRR